MARDVGRWHPWGMLACGRCWAVVLTLAAIGACEDDDDPGDDDDSVPPVGDAGADADAGGDAAPNDYPRCEHERFGWVWASGTGDRTEQLRDGLTLAVTGRGGEGLTLGEDFACDPIDEVGLSVDFGEAPAEAWLPPAGRRVAAQVWESDESSYALLRSPEGELLWEGGIVPTYAPGAPVRFRVVEDPLAVECTFSDLPASDPCCCHLEVPLRVSVTTDTGDVELGAGEQQVVEVEGESFLAVVRSAIDIREQPCIDDGWYGPRAGVYLVRTTPIELPVADPGPEMVDECAEQQPAQWDPCTTRVDLQCDYTWGDGCTVSYECRACFWRETGRGQPQGVDCGIDPWDCMLNEEGCPEEAVCTECSCPDPIGERWRCVWPGDPCPACE